MKEIILFSKKQQLLIQYLKITNHRDYLIKPNNQLSPIGWHLIHCLYIECLWLRKYYLEDNSLSNKLENIADSKLVLPKNRGLNLPNYEQIINLCKKEFKNNLIIINKIIEKKIKKKISIEYLISFLINHHSQHLETIKIILNLIHLKNFSEKNIIFKSIEPKVYKFKSFEINEGFYYIGANNLNFSYDNELPRNKKFIKSFNIAKKPIRIDEWYAFIKEDGYKRKELWSEAGWIWRLKNNVTYPLNWRLKNNKLSLSTPFGFRNPDNKQTVTNISLYELEAFAKYNNLKIPHELQWEAASNKLKNKYKVWEWCKNNFFPYSGFRWYPYREYSTPWFNNNYFTLRGSSLYSEDQIRRTSFRNFYQAGDRFIFSGGRLSYY